MPLSIVENPKSAEKAKEQKLHLLLKRYFAVLSGSAKPKFKLLGNLDEKIKEAKNSLKNCVLCERNCKVNRLADEKGYCQITKNMLVSSFFEHFGEEYFLVPSFTIFFWSCNFSCQYCQNWNISQRFERPKKITPVQLASIIDKHARCKNVNFVGGEPTPQLPFILEALSNIHSNMPIVWNSNFYLSKKAMALLHGVIDIYLSDFKYGNDNCAKRLSKVKNYTKIIKRNHLIAAKDSELVIRHLMLPGHLECCTKPILKWIADNLRNKAVVNLMNQYTPCWKAFQYREISRYLSDEEFTQATNYAEKLKLSLV